MKQEAVELRLRQRIGALLFDGVLGGHDQEQPGQGIGGGTHGDLAFRHGLQQGGLHLGRGAVDLVCQDQVVKQRAALKVKRPVLGPEHIGAGEVGWQQVRGKLDAVEVALYALAEYTDGPGLGKTRRALHQQVAVGQQRDQQAIHQLFLAQDTLGYLVLQVAERLLGGRGLGLCLDFCFRIHYRSREIVCVVSVAMVARAAAAVSCPGAMGCLMS